MLCNSSEEEEEEDCQIGTEKPPLVCTQYNGALVKCCIQHHPSSSLHWVLANTETAPGHDPYMLKKKEKTLQARILMGDYAHCLLSMRSAVRVAQSCDNLSV